MSWISLVGVLVVGGGMLTRKSPLVYETRAPAAQWADGPMKLVPTPQFESGTDDLLTTSATHMTLLHNSLIRGYNSIRLQASHVRDEDKADFLGYTKTWLRFATSHHDDEEEVLFPEIRSMLGDAKVWQDVSEEHETLLHGLNKLDGYLGSLSNATALAPGALLALLDALLPTLENHLHHEVSVMADMATHAKAPARDSFEGAVASVTPKNWGKNTVRKAGLTNVVPFFLLNADRTAERGMWTDWPPMPRSIRWAMVNVVGAVHGGWWRFASCDARGRPRDLYALAMVGRKASSEL